MMNLYSVDVRIYGTAYVRAGSEQEALAKARELRKETLEVSGALISGRRFNDPDLPLVSLSPAMTIEGPDADEIAELVTEEG